ncbi:MAG: FAD-binding oxidoreductase [Catenulispora sp.]|nr:FAD-binding oxidoreductase [Catenulispora sp.]
MTTRPHVVVIGGGVLGACVAGACAARSARVTLLDAAVPGSGTSSTSFAWANAQKKRPDSYFRLNADGLAEYHRLAEAGIGSGWFHAVGNVEIAVDTRSAEALEANVADLAARGYAAEHVTVRQAADLEPFIDPDRIVAAAYFREEGWVDAEKMIADALATVRAASGEIRTHHPVAGFEQAGTRTKVLLANGEEVVADYVVCATGIATEGLLRDSGITVPMISENQRKQRAPGDERYTAVGGLAFTAPLRTPLRRIVHTPDMGLRPSAQGRAVLGGDGAGSRVPRTDDAVFENGPRLLDRARKLFPAMSDVTLDAVRIGVRPIPADGLTVAGFTQTMPGLYLVVTHSGITLAQYLSRLVADEVLGSEQVAALADFRPQRFAGAARAPE